MDELEQAEAKLVDALRANMYVTIFQRPSYLALKEFLGPFFTGGQVKKGGWESGELFAVGGYEVSDTTQPPARVANLVSGAAALRQGFLGRCGRHRGC